MKSKFKVYGIYMPIFLIVLPLVVALGTVACIKYLEPSGYFSNSLISNIANGITLGAVIFFLSYIITARKDMRFIPSFASPLNYGPCAIVGTALLFVAVHLFTLTDFSGKNGFIGTYVFILAIFALLAVAYFAISAVSVKRRSIRRSDYGILVLIFICAYVAYIFFDGNTPINSPIKIISQMSALAVAVFFLYETRLSLGRERWRPYVAFSFIAALLSAYSSIPAIIVYFVSGKVINISIYETVLTFAFFIFTMFKLFLVGELVPERSSKVVEGIIEYANARAEELAPAEEEAPAEEDEADENQMSIADIDLEAEVIDAPTVEEGFLLEQETPLTEETITEEPEKDAEEAEIQTPEEEEKDDSKE